MKRTLALSVCAMLLAGPSARASTLTQNLSWTVDRSGTSTKYRVVAYGDSIYAGYYGSITNVIKRAATTVDTPAALSLATSSAESRRPLEKLIPLARQLCARMAPVASSIGVSPNLTPPPPWAPTAPPAGAPEPR